MSEEKEKSILSFEAIEKASEIISKIGVGNRRVGDSNIAKFKTPTLKIEYRHLFESDDSYKPSIEQLDVRDIYIDFSEVKFIASHFGDVTKQEGVLITFKSDDFVFVVDVTVEEVLMYWQKMDLIK